MAVTLLAAELDRLRGLLAVAGHAWTRPRAAVLQVLVAASAPLKVEAIHAGLGQWPGGRGINLSSVYRTVNLLHALGMVRRGPRGRPPPRGRAGAERRGAHHR